MTSKISLCVALLSLCFLTQCTPKQNLRGNFPTTEMIAELRPGLTQSQVRDILGPPTTIAPFQKNTWYYEGEHTEQLAFFQPKVTEQQILKVLFNETGELAEAWRVSGATGRPLDTDSMQTPSHGHDTNLWTEVFGGIRPGVAP